MFSNRLTYDMKPSGKKVEGFLVKRNDQFKIGWQPIISNNQIKLNYAPENLASKSFDNQDSSKYYNNQQELIQSLKKYQNIKNKKSDGTYQYHLNQSNKLDQSSRSYDSKRQPIMPRESMADILHGKNISNQIKVQLKQSNIRNRSTFKMGDNYNYFHDNQPLNTKKQAKFVDMHEKIQDIYDYNERTSKRRVSNIFS